MMLYVYWMIGISVLCLVGLIICLIYINQKGKEMDRIYDEIESMGDLTGISYGELEQVLGEPNMTSESSDGYFKVSWQYGNGAKNSSLERGFKLNAIFDEEDLCVKYRLSSFDKNY